MFGIAEKPIVCQNGVLPVLTASGIAVMSINLILDKEDEAVVWRGPLIANAITQFWEEVYWGKLDYLIVDLPPGTADVPLTVLQSIPVSGVVMVFTPQELTAMIVRKAVKMVHEMDKRIIGVVENMSYLYLDDIDRKIEIFGTSRGEEMAAVAGAPLLAQIPIDPRLARLCDEGRIEEYQSELTGQLADGITESLSRDEGQEASHDRIRE
jgi:hydrogenase maturation protease